MFKKSSKKKQTTAVCFLCRTETHVKKLPCQHIFCTKCLKSEKAKSHRKSSLICPACATVVVVPKDHVYNLPDYDHPPKPPKPLPSSSNIEDAKPEDGLNNRRPIPAPRKLPSTGPSGPEENKPPSLPPRLKREDLTARQKVATQGKAQVAINISKLHNFKQKFDDDHRMIKTKIKDRVEVLTGLIRSAEKQLMEATNASYAETGLAIGGMLEELQERDVQLTWLIEHLGKILGRSPGKLVPIRENENWREIENDPLPSVTLKHLTDFIPAAEQSLCSLEDNIVGRLKGENIDINEWCPEGEDKANDTELLEDDSSDLYEIMDDEARAGDTYGGLYTELDDDEDGTYTDLDIEGDNAQPNSSSYVVMKCPNSHDDYTPLTPDKTKPPIRPKPNLATPFRSRSDDLSVKKITTVTDSKRPFSYQEGQTRDVDTDNPPEPDFPPPPLSAPNIPPRKFERRQSSDCNTSETTTKSLHFSKSKKKAEPIIKKGRSLDS